MVAGPFSSSFRPGRCEIYSLVVFGCDSSRLILLTASVDKTRGKWNVKAAASQKDVNRSISSNSKRKQFSLPNLSRDYYTTSFPGLWCSSQTNGGWPHLTPVLPRASPGLEWKYRRNYEVAMLIPKHSKPLTEAEFIRDCVSWKWWKTFALRRSNSLLMITWLGTLWHGQLTRISWDIKKQPGGRGFPFIFSF